MRALLNKGRGLQAHRSSAVRKKKLPQGEPPVAYAENGQDPYPPRYDIGERIFWWARFWVAVLAVAGFGLAVGQWVMTRASVDYVDNAIIPLETKLNVEKIDQKIEGQQRVLGNVRDNLIILMDRQKAIPKPLPNPLPGETDVTPNSP